MDSTKFFADIERRSESDTSVVSSLRSALAADRVDCHVPAMKVVEPMLHGTKPWARRHAYLAAGLWGSAVRQGNGPALKLPVALKRMANDKNKATAIERRFVQLLDSDTEELPFRLRQIIALVASNRIALDWPALLDDLLRWGSPSRSVQIAWGRIFWGSETSGGTSEN